MDVPELAQVSGRFALGVFSGAGVFFPGSACSGSRAAGVGCSAGSGSAGQRCSGMYYYFAFSCACVSCHSRVAVCCSSSYGNGGPCFACPPDDAMASGRPLDSVPVAGSVPHGAELPSTAGLLHPVVHDVDVPLPSSTGLR